MCQSDPHSTVLSLHGLPLDEPIEAFEVPRADMYPATETLVYTRLRGHQICEARSQSTGA